MDGEHGGFTLRTPGHMWPGAPAAIYSGVADKDALTAKYVDNTRAYYLAAAGAELSGSVYTQVTDLENELNGLWTYDRREIKVDPAQVREINRRSSRPARPRVTATSSRAAAHWSLDENQGTTAADSGPNHSDLTLAEGDVLDARRTGLGAEVQRRGPVRRDRRPGASTPPETTPVSAWVTLDALPGNYATAVSQDGRRQENPFYLQYGQGAFAFSTPGGNRARLEMKPELGRWYHLVGVRDAATRDQAVRRRRARRDHGGRDRRRQHRPAVRGPRQVRRRQRRLLERLRSTRCTCTTGLTAEEVSALHDGEQP